MRSLYEDVLEHETRFQLNKFIRANPGASFTDLMNQVNLNNGVASYHLRVMEKAGLVRSIRTGGRRCYYSTAIATPEIPMSTAAKILAIVKSNPGTCQAAISNELKESRQVIHYHTHQLIKAGEIWHKTKGRKMLLFARFNA